ncbi:MAG: aminopeptidase N [Succinivibrionaceae bacterium]|nr:aminopeptidase N [Succinivibrionaceae bacterium]
MAKENFKPMLRQDYRPPLFTITKTDLTFSLSDLCTEVTQVSRVKRLTNDHGAPLVLDGEDLCLVSVTVDGAAVKYRLGEGRLTLDRVPDEFELRVVNTIAPAQNTLLMGLYKSNGCFCTQCEPEGFRRITYFLDRPDVMASYRVTILAPDDGCGALLSNGNLVEEGTRDGRRYAVWEDPYPKPCYLFALVAGTFDTIEDTFTAHPAGDVPRQVRLVLYVDRGAHDRGLWAMRCIKEAMRWDEERFGFAYDLDNFKVVAVDFFNQGAMENKSLNIFNSKFVLCDQHTATDLDFYNVESVIGHEYFHNYTGDRVTLRDWFQLSLKESLTVFRDQEFSSDVASRPLTRLGAVGVIRSRQFPEDSGPMAHPVRPERVLEMNNFYTVTIYDKGAEVIRMLQTLIGDQGEGGGTFTRAIREYLRRFDGQAVTIDDFLAVLSEVSGMDLGQFSRWYSQAGTPVVTAAWKWGQGGELSLTLSQSTPATPGQEAKEPFVIPVRLSFITPEGKDEAAAGGLPPSGMVVLDEVRQEFTFTGLPEGSLPVLLRDFSAPVRLVAPYTDSDYSRLLALCSDPFIKLNSAEELFARYMADSLGAAEEFLGQRDAAAKDEPVDSPEALAAAAGLGVPSPIIEAYRGLLERVEEDLVCASSILPIPSLETLMERQRSISLDATVHIHRFLSRSLSVALLDEYLALYERMRQWGDPRYSTEGMARRSLANNALFMAAQGLIALGRERQADSLCETQFRKASCMTETLGALRAAVHLGLPCAGQLLDAFGAEWDQDPLVLDNFFRIQATVPCEETLFVVRKLMSHPRYDAGNPNRIRALVGAMALSNPVALHRRDGAGYKLLCEVVAQLNGTNAHVGARILDGMLSFARYDRDRAQKAREQLQRLLQIKDLSRSIYEKVSAALGKD